MLLCRQLREQLIQLFNISAPSFLFLSLSKKNPEAAAKMKDEISYFYRQNASWRCFTATVVPFKTVLVAKWFHLYPAFKTEYTH